MVRRPVWRSERASLLMERLQQRINNSQQEDLRPRVPRVEGVLSERQIPRQNVTWALADIERATGGEHSEEVEEDERRTHSPISEQAQQTPPDSIVNRGDNSKRRRQLVPHTAKRRRCIIPSDSE